MGSTLHTAAIDSPPRLTRNFALASGFVILLAGVAMAFIERELTVSQLERMAERNNAALTQAFANQLWPEFAPFVSQAWRRAAEELRADARTAELHEAVRGLVADTHVLKVKLYDLHGTTAYSSAPEQIGADYSTNERFLAAIRGTTVSKLELRESFGSFDGPLANRWILSSYVPVRPGGKSGAIEGVAEIYSDVSELVANQRKFEATIFALIGVVSSIVFGLLLASVWRAERQISRHHQTEIELASNVVRAEAASKAKSTFLANMSHELKTPLNAIIGFSEIIECERTGPIGSPHYKAYAADINRSGRHLLSIINNVLDFVRLDSDELPVERGTVDPAAAALSVIDRHQDQAAAANIELALHCDRPVDAIESDRGRIEQILSNLVSNAIKFGRPNGRVTVTVTEDRDHVRFDVADDGIGMRKEDMPLAIAPFSQIDDTLARSVDGTGLGLPLSLHLAHSLGGELKIASTPGAGTTVTLRLNKADRPPTLSRGAEPAAA